MGALPKMKILTRISILFIILLLFLHISSLSSQAARDYSGQPQQPPPRPTLPVSSPGNPNYIPPTATANLIPPTRTFTPTITRTPTSTIDLSFKTFLTKTYKPPTPTSSATPFITPTQTLVIPSVKSLTTFSALPGTITPTPGMNTSGANGAILPVVIIVVILVGLFVYWRFRSKRQ